MNCEEYKPRLYWLAVATAAVAMLPIVIGALVTTLRAGMAFLDWPSSDGHNMFLYPWLSTESTDKFVEHGHRLAGALVGLLSIILAVAYWRIEPRRSVRWMALLVLLGVIGQGLLGGLRVINDDPRLAMVHGNFAAWVFSLMAALAVVSSREWLGGVRGPWSVVCGEKSSGQLTTDAEQRIGDVRHLRLWAVAMIVVVFMQFVLGGLLRHLGYALHEHLAFAGLVLVVVLPTVVTAQRSGIAWLQRPAWLLGGLVVTQVALGIGAWVTKFGFAMLDYVAVHESTAQIFFRTAHFVVGVLVFMSSTTYALRVFRIVRLHPQKKVSSPMISGLTVQGGLG